MCGNAARGGGIFNLAENVSAEEIIDEGRLVFIALSLCFHYHLSMSRTRQVANLSLTRTQ